MQGGGIAQPQLLPECIASKGMPHLRPSLAKPVGCNAPRARTPTALAAVGYCSAVPPASSHPYTRCRTDSGDSAPADTRMFSASGRNDSRTVMAAVLVKRHHCSNREGGAGTPPLPNASRAPRQRWVKVRELPRVTNATSRGSYMSRRGLRATAPRVASTWYNLGSPTGE